MEPFPIGFSRTPKTSMSPLGAAIIVFGFGIMVTSLLLPVEPFTAFGLFVLVLVSSFGVYARVRSNQNTSALFKDPTSMQYHTTRARIDGDRIYIDFWNMSKDAFGRMIERTSGTRSIILFEAQDRYYTTRILVARDPNDPNAVAPQTYRAIRAWAGSRLEVVEPESRP